MADREVNSKQDTAYIEDLLSKLRQTLGPTSPVQEEQPVPSQENPATLTPESEDVPNDSPAVREENTPLAEQEPQEQAIAPGDMEKTVNVQAEDLVSVEEELPPFMPIPDGVADIPVAEVEENEECSVPSQESQSSAQIPDEPVQTDIFDTYAHTVVPSDSHISSRHPSGDFALRLGEWEEEQQTVTPVSVPTDAEPIEELSLEILSELLGNQEPDIPATAEAAAEPVVEEPVSLIQNEGEPATQGLAEPTEEPVLPQETVIPATARDTVVDLFQDEEMPYEPPLYEPFEDILSGVKEEKDPVSSWNTSSAADLSTASITRFSLPEVEDRPQDSRCDREFTRSMRIADCQVQATGKVIEIRDSIIEEPIESMGGASSDKQKTAWKQEIASRYRRSRINLICSTALFVILALFELIPALHQHMLERMLLTRVQGAALLIDLQLLLLICLFGWKSLWRGVTALFRKVCLPESLAFFSALLSVIMTAVLLLSRTSVLLLCGLMGAFPVVASIFSDHMRLVAVRNAYRACTVSDHKYTTEKTMLGEHPLLSSISYAYPNSTPLAEVKNAPTLEGFVAGCRFRKEEKLPVLVALIMATAVALIDAITLLVVKDSALYALWSATVVFCAALPLSHFLHHKLFLASLSTRIAKERVAVSGEDAVYSFANTTIMTYEDVEAFPAGSVKINGIKLCGDFPLDKALFLMASLFDCVGGPLGGIFRGSASNMSLADTVEIKEIVPGGICAEINHETVHVGTKEYLEDRGIEVFTEAEDDHADEHKNRVLHVAYCQRHAAKFHVHYEVCHAFEANAEYHAKHGVSSVILTADPLISEELLETITYVSEYRVRVVCKDIDSLTEKAPERQAVSLVSYGPKRSLRRMPFFFTAYCKMQKWSVHSSAVLSGALAIVLPVLLGLTGSAGVWMPFTVQVLCAIPCVTLACLVRLLNPNPACVEQENDTSDEKLKGAN